MILINLNNNILKIKKRNKKKKKRKNQKKNKIYNK